MRALSHVNPVVQRGLAQSFLHRSWHLEGEMMLLVCSGAQLIHPNKRRYSSHLKGCQVKPTKPPPQYPPGKLGTS